MKAKLASIERKHEGDEQRAPFGSIQPVNKGEWKRVIFSVGFLTNSIVHF